MINDLDKLIAAERKNARRLKDLRDLRAKALRYKAPDQKLIGMIDAEVKKLLEPE